MNTTMVKAHHPDYARQAIEAETSLHACDLMGKINIRGDANNSQFVTKISHALNMALPLKVNTKQSAGEEYIYCLGPDEWTFYTDINTIESRCSAIKEALKDIHCAVVDISDYYTQLLLEGPDAERILKTASPLDMRLNQFPVGTISQTRYGHASIILDRVAESRFIIQIRWSYTEYLWDYLNSAHRVKTAR